MKPRMGGPSDKCASCGHARALHRPSGCGPNAVGGYKCGCTRFVEAGVLPNVIPIGTAKDQKVDSRYLGIGSQTTFRKLGFGTVGVIANAKIQVVDAAGRAFELSEEDARDVIEAFQHARYVARLWREKLSGFNTVRVTRWPDGAIDVTCHGQTHRMRRLEGRKDRHCSACKARRGGAFYVVADPGKPWNRYHFVEVCEPCVTELALAPTSLRELPRTGGIEEKPDR
jgi:hypothetical protein